jgi:hypothetical protein
LLAEISNVDLCRLVSRLDLFNLSPCDRRSISAPSILVDIFLSFGPSSDEWVGTAGGCRGEDRLGLDRRRCSRTRTV